MGLDQLGFGGKILIHGGYSYEGKALQDSERLGPT